MQYLDLKRHNIQKEDSKGDRTRGIMGSIVIFLDHESREKNKNNKNNRKRQITITITQEQSIMYLYLYLYFLSCLC